MAGKRIAHSRISKDNPEGESSDEGEHSVANEMHSLKEERKKSRPLRRLNHGDRPAAHNPFAALSNAPETAKKEDADYNLQLRGLNQSFYEAAKRKLEANAAADLSSLFVQYEDHLKSIRRSHNVEDAMMTESPVKAPPIPSFSVPAPASSAAAAAASSFSFPLAASSKTVEAPVPSTPLGGGPATDSTKGQKSDTPRPAAFGFGFGKSETSQVTTEEAKPALSFAFGSQSTPTTNPLDSSKPRAFTFGTPAVDNAVEEKRPVAFSFGVGPEAQAAPSPAEASSGKSSLAFAFGQSASASESKPAAASFKFGDGTENKGPVPFSFGGSSTTSSAPFQFSFGAPLPSFGTKTASTATGRPTEDENDENNDGADGIPAGEEESFGNERTNTELIRRGVGEEDEKPLAEQRCKLYILDKESGWKDLGIVIIKINHCEATEKARIIARAEGSGKMLLNSWINETMTAEYTKGKRELSLLCVNQEGRIAKYAVRCKEAADVKAFYEKLVTVKPSQ